MDELIARIRERIADPLLAVDSVAWVRPMPIVAPVASSAEVDLAEIALGFGIPLLLRRLYTEVANGGFGPIYGLEGVPTIPPREGTADIVQLFEMYSQDSREDPAQVWPRGWVPLLSGGCLYFECVDFLHPPHAVVLFDPSLCVPARPVLESLRPVAVSLEARLEAWLAGERLW